MRPEFTARAYGKRPSIVERFWRQVEKTENCWLWTGAKHPLGYGRIHARALRPRVLTAHRASWEIHFGEIPAGLNVLHRCDNPPCVRPDHLYLGTLKDNSRDVTERKRWPNRQGENSGTAILTVEQVRDIRSRRASGETGRSIALNFGISNVCVYDIVNRKRWKDVQ